MKRLLMLGCVFGISSILCVAVAQQSTTYIGHYLSRFPGPQAYRDPGTGTLLYVESDGRHVAAISAAGKLLWNRDPFKDAHLEHYRTDKPQIVYIGPDSESVSRPEKERKAFVALEFNSSQFGLLRISDGEFKFQGQD